MTNIILKPADGIVEYLTGEIASRLSSGQCVLWLVPGGSASAVAIEVLRRLEQTDTSRLLITLTDERYGALGHPNENWTQLANAGFRPTREQTYRVLTGDDPTQTVGAFARQLTQWLDEADFSIGLFGIGADGHTAGIKPGSVAVMSQEPVAYFCGEDFERITITPLTIARLDEAVAYARGKAKFPALAQLLDLDESIEVQPAQSLKQAGKAVLFSDYQQTKKEERP